MALDKTIIESDQYKELIQLSIVKNPKTIDEGMLGIDSSGLKDLVIQSLIAGTPPGAVAGLLEFMRSAIHEMINTKIDQSICFCTIVHEGKVSIDTLEETYKQERYNLPSKK